MATAQSPFVPVVRLMRAKCPRCGFVVVAQSTTAKQAAELEHNAWCVTVSTPAPAAPPAVTPAVH